MWRPRAGTRACPYRVTMLTKDLAICIRAVDYSETSQVVTFFTRATGKIGAIAKGSKRPKSAFDGPIEIFAHGKIVFSDSNKEKLATLTEFEPACGQAGFIALRSNLFVLNCCLLAVELLNKLTNDYDPHPGLFDNFIPFLQNANEQAASNDKQAVLALLILFQLVLLREVGLQPILSHCANCKTQYALRNTQYEAYFSSSANGLVCRDCEVSFPDKIRLTHRAAACLSDLKHIADSDTKTLNEIEKILIHHFTELLGRPPKMARHILGG
jgi:DNA repair protein RecO (recombination protein O)